MTEAKNGMVVAKHPLAARTGVEILQKGGNAVDAAVATAFSVGVLEPFMSGLGGGGVMVLHLRGANEDIVIDYTPSVPSSAKAEMFEVIGGADGSYDWPAVKGNANLIGYKACLVPGNVAGLCHAIEKYGELELKEILEPAISFAKKGFPVSSYTALCIALSMDVLSRFPESAQTFLREGRFPYRSSLLEPALGADTIVQPKLAHTLERIASLGPEAFYKGEISEAICRDMDLNGGLIKPNDLASYAPRITKPLVGTYREHEIYTTLSHGGPTMMEILNILEGYDLKKLGYCNAKALHLIAEAMRMAFNDRYTYLADPDSEHVPLENLMSKEHANDLRKSIGSGLAGTFSTTYLEDHGHTTHLSVIDKERNMVSLTQTLGDFFGSGVVIKDTGIVMNNGMNWFDPRPGALLSIKPKKRPLAAPSPTLVLKAGRPFLTLGAPGFRRIIGAVAQVIIHVIDYDMGIQQAIEAPRLDNSTQHLILDSRIPSSVRQQLEAMGKRLLIVKEELSSFNFASPTGIQVDTGGNLHGGVDPFKPDNVAMGY